MKIAVYGSAYGDQLESQRAKAREVGRVLARRGHDLITGGCPGLPYEAVLGVFEISETEPLPSEFSRKSRVYAFSPALNIEDHMNRFQFPTQGFTDWIFVPEDYLYKGNKKACFKYRNISSTLNCDAGIIIAGRMGTANEFTLLWEFGKPIGILRGTRGVSEILPELAETANKPTGAVIIAERNPEILISRLEKLAEQK